MRVRRVSRSPTRWSISLWFFSMFASTTLISARRFPLRHVDKAGVVDQDSDEDDDHHGDRGQRHSEELGLAHRVSVADRWICGGESSTECAQQ